MKYAEVFISFISLNVSKLRVSFLDVMKINVFKGFFCLIDEFKVLGVVVFSCVQVSMYTYFLDTPHQKKNKTKNKKNTTLFFFFTKIQPKQANFSTNQQSFLMIKHKKHV